MLTRFFAVLLCVASAGTVALAHHSYGGYIREQNVSIEGVLDQVTVANPHGILMLRTDDGTMFTAEWASATQLQRAGVVPGMLAVGDRVIVRGSPARDPESHRLSLLTEVRRPRDGWQWLKAGVVSK